MSLTSNNHAIAEAAAAWVAARDAGLAPAQAAELKRWLASDPRHASAFEHYAYAWSALDRPRAGNSTEAVLRALRGRTLARRQRRLAAAACAAVLAVAGALTWRATLAPEAAAPVASVHNGVLLAPETRTLSDGTVVELKHGAEISVEFNEQVRRVVLLRGEAHFQVAKNKAWPFAVDAGGVQVRAVGTAFSVQRESHQIEVLVTEGKIAIEKPVAAEPVAVATAGAPSPAPVVMQTLATVSAGERIALPTAVPAAAPEVVTVTEAELNARLAWRAPRVEFSETPLAEAVAMMNRSARDAAAPQLVLDPSARRLAREPVSGVFRADNTEAFVRVLELSLGVQTERRGNQLVMRCTD